MRIAIGIGLMGATLLLAGCFFHKPSHPSGPSVGEQQVQPVAKAQPKPVIDPDTRASGRVAMVNDGARFVVISFPPGPMPHKGERLGIYRGGLKVGEVTVTGPQHENDTVADMTVGEIQLHDEAREQ